LSLLLLTRLFGLNRLVVHLNLPGGPLGTHELVSLPRPFMSPCATSETTHFCDSRPAHLPHLPCLERPCNTPSLSHLHSHTFTLTRSLSHVHSHTFTLTRSLSHVHKRSQKSPRFQIVNSLTDYRYKNRVGRVQPQDEQPETRV
jgi:hypothetical protein